MNKYKEKYQQLTSEIETFKEDKQILEMSLEKIKNEKTSFSIKETEQKVELEYLKKERFHIVNKHTKIYITIKNIILLALLVLAISSGVNIVSGISTIGMKILTSIGLFIGFGNLYAIAVFGINILNDFIINRVQNKNKKGEKYLEITKEISKANKTLAETKEKQEELIQNITQIENIIKLRKEQIDLKETQLANLKEEIIKLLVEDSVKENNEQQEITKPYTKIKRPN